MKNIVERCKPTSVIEVDVSTRTDGKFYGDGFKQRKLMHDYVVGQKLEVLRRYGA